MIFIREVTLSYGHKNYLTKFQKRLVLATASLWWSSNGSGKTTLLRMLMGEVNPDDGFIEKPDYATVGYLPQDGVHASEEVCVTR